MTGGAIALARCALADYPDEQLRLDELVAIYPAATGLEMLETVRAREGESGIFRALDYAIAELHDQELFEREARQTRERAEQSTRGLCYVPGRRSATFQTVGEWIDPNAEGFLRCFEWRRVRMIVLERQGAKCACCGATAADGAVMHVDHIKPRLTHPDLALTIDNLQVLCDACNHGKGSLYNTDWRRKDGA